MSERNIWLACIALGALSICVALYTLWNIYNTIPQPSVQLGDPEVFEVNVRPPDIDRPRLLTHSEIDKWGALFGVVERVSAPPVPISDIPISKMDIELLATFTHSPEQYSSAFIRVDDAVPLRYIQGEQLTNTVKLYSIQVDSIVVETSDGLEKVYFPFRQQ